MRSFIDSLSNALKLSFAPHVSFISSFMQLALHSFISLLRSCCSFARSFVPSLIPSFRHSTIRAFASRVQSIGSFPACIRFSHCIHSSVQPSCTPPAHSCVSFVQSAKLSPDLSAQQPALPEMSCVSSFSPQVGHDGPVENSAGDSNASQRTVSSTSRLRA